MARQSKAVFKMAGYTYPGTSPMQNQIEEKRVDADKLVDAQKREEDAYVVPVPSSKLDALSKRVKAIIPNIRAERKFKKKHKKKHNQ